MGESRGLLAAALDANGAAIGSVGLAAFGFCIFLFSDRPLFSIAIGLLSWSATSYGLSRLLRSWLTDFRNDGVLLHKLRDKRTLFRLLIKFS